MPCYHYLASDVKGRNQKGELDADNLVAARAQLKALGLFPLMLERREGTANAAPKLGLSNVLTHRFGRILSSADLAFVTRQVAVLLSAGLPLERALQSVIEQSEKVPMRELLMQIKNALQEGQSFATAIGQYPKEFSTTYRALIKAGEESRDLGLVMNKLADYVEARNALRQKMIQAFTYPAIVTTLSLGIVIFLLSYVVPQIASVFTANKQVLPLLTRIMLSLSAFVRDYGVWVGLVIVVLVLAFQQALRQPLLRVQWHRALLKVPIFGRLILGFNTSQFASTLAILFGSGVPILHSMQVARDTITNNALQLTIDNALVRVREGVSVARALSEYAYFPPGLLHLIRFGEESGQLAPMLERAAQGEARDLERRTLLLTSLLEPILVLAMGGVVLVIVLAVLLPIIEVNQIIR